MLRLEGAKPGTRAVALPEEALPYVDSLNQVSRQQVEALILDEALKSAKRPADYLQEMGPGPTLKFEHHPLLAAEYERVKAKQPMKPLDTSRFRLDPPPASKQNDPAAWRAATDNAHAQLEHQYLRILNLELLLKYGDKTWRAQTQLSEATHKQTDEELHATKKRITELNQERKLSQMAAGAELRKLYDEYFEAVRKNLDIENACDSLQDEVDRMRARIEKHEQRLRQEQEQEKQQDAQQEAQQEVQQNGPSQQEQHGAGPEGQSEAAPTDSQGGQQQQGGGSNAAQNGGTMDTS